MKLMKTIKDYTFKTNCDLLEPLYTNATLSVKIGQQIGRKFGTNSSVPQGGGFSPKLFTFHLDHALGRVTERFCPNSEQSYTSRPDLLLFHVEYADDIDFIPSEPEQNVAVLITQLKED